MAVTIHSHHLWYNCHAIASVGARRESFKYSEPSTGMLVSLVTAISINSSPVRWVAIKRVGNGIYFSIYQLLSPAAPLSVFSKQIHHTYPLERSMICTAKKQVYQGKNQRFSSVRKFGKFYANTGSKLEKSRYAPKSSFFLLSFSYHAANKGGVCHIKKRHL